MSIRRKKTCHNVVRRNTINTRLKKRRRKKVVIGHEEARHKTQYGIGRELCGLDAREFIRRDKEEQN